MGTDADRVRHHTADAVLRRIDDHTTARLLTCADSPPEVAAQRLRALEREWDTDRVIEAEAAVTALAGLALGAWVDRRLLAIPGAVGAALLAYAFTGWYPLLPLLRRLGVRSAREVERERYAVKALRGDFADLDPAPPRSASGGVAASPAGLH